MKPLKDMTLEELVNYFAGRLIISIGAGKFRDEVSITIQMLLTLGAENAKRK